MLTKNLDRKVTLSGITEIMFDRYPGDNKTKLTPEQKLYLSQDRALCFPALNIMSFLSAKNTESAPKMLLDSREYKKVADALASCTSIAPISIPFLRNGKPIKFGEFKEGSDGVLRDDKSGAYVAYHVARVEKGIPNPKERPVIGLPWSLEFRLMVQPHPQLSEEMIEDLFTRGGAFLGLGTFRKVYGKFEFSWK